jgi:multicomponent Na+:H+ antiporter subunit D
MGAVAVLCVTYGLLPDWLFGLLPGVTPGAYAAFPGAGASTYTVFTVGHLIEGFGLAAIGLVGFAVLRTPLSRVGVVPDVDAVYNRAAFYGARAVVVGITELYAAVDRVVVTTARTATWSARNPVAVLASVAPRALPERVRANGDEELDGHLQANIGQATLVVVAVLVAGFLLLFLAV